MSNLDLGHIGYVVPVMESALRRWKEDGANVVIPPTLDPIQNVVCCLLEVDGFLPVELVAPSSMGVSPIESRLRRGGGLDHVCYLVDELASVLSAERELGSLVVCEPVHATVFNRDIAFVQRRTGFVVEYMTRLPTEEGICP